MWNPRPLRALARMPSTHGQPLNPRVAGIEVPAAAQPIAAALVLPGAVDDEERARAGGFHESSFELKRGLEVNESEWPEETTIPGRLGDR